MYTFQNGGSDLIDIDSLNGIMTTKGNLDYEKLGDGHKYYVVRVVVMVRIVEASS